LNGFLSSPRPLTIWFAFQKFSPRKDTCVRSIENEAESYRILRLKRGSALLPLLLAASHTSTFTSKTDFFSSLLEIKGNREKAAELKDLAQALLFFSQADKNLGDQHVAWAQHQLQLFKTQVDMLGNGQGGAPSPGAPLPTPGGVPPLGISAPMMPPIHGARQAPDGHWYLSDPARPGKYLRIIH
jgi:hypothetical protein